MSGRNISPCLLDVGALLAAALLRLLPRRGLGLGPGRRRVVREVEEAEKADGVDQLVALGQLLLPGVSAV